MTLWIDVKYARIVGQSLEHFKIKKDKPFSATYRCNYCGDSQKNKLKTRGYFYENRGKVSSKCFNCGISKTISSFLFEQSPQLYKEYKLETLKDSGGFVQDYTPFKEATIIKEKKLQNKKSILDKLTRVSRLPVGHPCKKYVEYRKIPSKQHYRLYYVDKFFAFINTILPDKFDEKALGLDRPMLVMPFVDSNGDVFGLQGRVIEKHSSGRLRYITIMINTDVDKLFGLDVLDINRTTLVFEGPLDSLMFDNAIALAGSDGNFGSYVDKNKTVIVFDNEPRNIEIVSRMNRVIEDDWSIFIWDETIKEKDVGDIIMNGTMTIDQLQSHIVTNAVSGLQAKLKMTKWRR